MEESTPSPPISPYVTPPHLSAPSASSREPSPPKKQRPAIPPKFAKPLRDFAVREGERAVLECWVDPYPQPERIQWFLNSVEIQVSPDYEIGYENGVCALVISEVFPEDAGNYTCTVTISGLANSTSMYLTVNGVYLEESLRMYISLNAAKRDACWFLRFFMLWHCVSLTPYIVSDVISCWRCLRCNFGFVGYFWLLLDFILHRIYNLHKTVHALYSQLHVVIRRGILYGMISAVWHLFNYHVYIGCLYLYSKQRERTF